MENLNNLNKKILVMFTGGTIGSTVDGNVINVDGSGGYKLISEYEKLFGKKADFECRQIFNVLSENISFKNWETLISEISDINYDDYSGVILTHGSDTLAYTSALIGMYFRHMPLPFFIIASNKPIGEPDSNGLFNFAAAVDKILNRQYSGVFTIYDKVFLPTRIIPADTYCDRFISYGDNGVHKNPEFRGVTDNQLKKEKEKIFHDKIKFDNKIMLLHCYPGLDFSLIDIDKKSPAAVLISPYHSATACVSEEFGKEYSLPWFIEECIKRNIMVYICGVKKRGGRYDSYEKIIGAGSIPLYHISDVSAYMKLLIAYNQNEKTVAEIMNTNLYFEILY